MRRKQCSVYGIAHFFVAISSAAIEVCSRAQPFISVTLHLNFVWCVSDRLLSCLSPALYPACSSVSTSLSCPSIPAFPCSPTGYSTSSSVLCFWFGRDKVVFPYSWLHHCGLQWIDMACTQRPSDLFLFCSWKGWCSLIPCITTEQHYRGGIWAVTQQACKWDSTLPAPGWKGLCVCISRGFLRCSAPCSPTDVNAFLKLQTVGLRIRQGLI